MTKNWGNTDLCKPLTKESIESFFIPYGQESKTYVALLTALLFNETEKNNLKSTQDLCQQIYMDHNKSSRFKQLLEVCGLRTTHPKKKDYEIGFPKIIYHQIVFFPMFSSQINMKTLMLVYIQTVKTRVRLFESDFMELCIGNSQIQQKDTFALFAMLAKEDDIQIQIHHGMFPDRSPTVFGPPIRRGQQLAQNQIIFLENEGFYHLVSLNYVASRQFMIIQEEKIDVQTTNYTEYLQKRRQHEETNHEKISFYGVDPYDWSIAKIGFNLSDFYSSSDSSQKSWVERNRNFLSQINSNSSQQEAQSQIIPNTQQDQQQQQQLQKKEKVRQHSSQIISQFQSERELDQSIDNFVAPPPKVHDTVLLDPPMSQAGSISNRSFHQYDMDQIIITKFQGAGEKNMEIENSISLLDDKGEVKKNFSIIKGELIFDVQITNIFPFKAGDNLIGHIWTASLRVEFPSKFYFQLSLSDFVRGKLSSLGDGALQSPNVPLPSGKQNEKRKSVDSPSLNKPINKKKKQSKK